METDTARLKKLVQEHEAIRAELKRMDDSLSASVRSELLAGQLQQLQTVLFYVRDGIKEHIARDEQALQPLVGRLSLDSLTREHREIEQEIERAIRLTDCLAQENSNKDELRRCRSDIRRTVHRVHELIVVHTATEDSVIELLRKELER